MWLDAAVAASLEDTDSDGGIDRIVDQSGSGNSVVESSSGQQPAVVAGAMNGQPAIGFDGSNDRLRTPDTADINTSGPYDAKTLVVAFRTGADVTGRQVVYEQGSFPKGLNVYIDGGQLYFGVWDMSGWGSKFVDTAIASDASYVATLAFDGVAGTVTGYLDGVAVGTLSGAGTLGTHNAGGAIGAMRSNSRFHDGSQSGSGHYFGGQIGELAYYNSVLTETERAGIEAYMQSKWIGAEATIGTDQHDVIDRSAETGPQYISGLSGDDVLIGGTGPDRLVGSAGDDSLVGEQGDDRLVGGEGSDAYVFGRNDGTDRIDNVGSNSASTDKLVFEAGIAAEQLWFTQQTDDLRIDVVGNDGTVLVADWFSVTSKRIDQVETADGSTLLATDVQQLVDAMAAFAPPTGINENLPQSTLDQLQPTLSAAWTPGV